MQLSKRLIYRVSIWLKTASGRDLWLPLIVYGVVLVFVTWPLTAQLSTHVAGPEYGDSVEYLRLGWWGKYALQNGLNPFYQSLFGYPTGFFSTVQWAQPLIYWPISALNVFFNPTESFNLWLLIETLLSGLTAYWLCRYAINRLNAAVSNAVLSNATLSANETVLAALFGGMIFMIFPTIQGHLIGGHINPLANYAFPPTLWCFLRIVERQGGIRTALLGGVALFILALGNFTFPAYILLPLFVFVGGYYLLFRRRQILNKAVLLNLLVMAGFAIMLILPFYLPLASELLSPNRPNYLQEGGWVTFSTDPLSFINLSSQTAWTAPIASEFSRRVLIPNMIEDSAYLGVLVVLLTLVALYKYPRHALLWLTVALGCMLFSLGPLLKWNDQLVTYKLGNDVRSNIVLPYALFQNLPFINGTRTPARFNITTGLALGILAAIGLSVLLPRLRRFRWQVIFTVLCCVMAIAEYQVAFPFPTTLVQAPAYLEALEPHTEMTRGIMDIPFEDRIAQKDALFAQTYHRKPLIAGYVSRGTSIDPVRLSFLEAVATNQAYTPDLNPLSNDSARTLLHDNGVGLVIYHWSTLSKNAVNQWAVEHFYQPMYQDRWVSAFEIPDPKAPADTSAVAFAPTGWWTGSDARWMTGDASLYVYLPHDRTLSFNFTLIPLLQPRQMQVFLDGQMIQMYTVTGPEQPHNLWIPLNAGLHILRFVQPEGCTPVMITPVCLRDKSISPVDPTCQIPKNLSNPLFTKPLIETQNQTQSLCVSVGLSKFSFGDQPLDQASSFVTSSVNFHDAGMNVILSGYALPHEAAHGETMIVQTNWQVTAPPAGDYHLFVHILDQSGKLVAQADLVPGEGKFPTSQWKASQHWVERIPLTLPADMQAGRYSVYTGWYRYPELTRLTVDSNTPHAADGLAYLGDLMLR